MASRLVVRGVDAGYGAVRVLHGVSIEVREGETVALLGTNGNGKSTLIKCIMGMIAPEAGEVVLESDGTRVDLTRRSTEEIVSLGIALVPEGRRLFGQMTVIDNLRMGAYVRNDKDIDRDIDAVFERFPVLLERRDQIAATLSGGEQQMLAIGRALVSRPRLLLLDEPSLGLAPKFITLIFRALRELKAEGKTILLVEQNARKALQVADYAYVMERGRIVLSGTGQDVLNMPEVQKTYLGQSAA